MSQAEAPIIADTVKTAVHAVIRRYRRLNSQNLRVIVGLSGGADSIALLKCISLVSQDILAVHIVHDIRSRDEAEHDLSIARQAAQNCGVDFLSLNIFPKKFAEERSENLESTARNLRYAALSKAAHTRLEGDEGKNFIRKDSQYYTNRNWKAVIATAHHADDQLETLLMRLCRGSGLSGMSGIASKIERGYPGQHSIIRPMLDITRADSEAICNAYGLEYATDSTNMDEMMSRNKIRHQVVPVLKSLYPRAAEHSTELAEIMTSAQQVVEKQACGYLDCNSGSSPGNWLSASSDWLRIQQDIVIYEWIRGALLSVCNGGSVSYDKINNQMVDDVVQAIRKRKTKTFFWPNRAIEVGIERVKVRTLTGEELRQQDKGFKE